MNKKMKMLRRAISVALAAATALSLGTMALAAGQATARTKTTAAAVNSFETIFERYQSIVSQVADSSARKALAALLEDYEDAAEDTQTACEKLLDALDVYGVDAVYQDNSRELDTDAILDAIGDLSSSSVRTRLKSLVKAYLSALETEQEAREALEEKLGEYAGTSVKAANAAQTTQTDLTRLKDRFMSLGAESRQKLEKMADELGQAIEKGKAAIQSAPQGQQRDQVTQTKNTEIQKLIAELEKEAARQGVKLELPRQWHS
jgi:hypothetical protein